MLWLAFRFLASKSKSLFQGTAWVSFIGLILGVASLVLSMAVMSGFESTLKKSVADVTGHLRIRKSSVDKESWVELFQRIQKNEPLVQDYMQYSYLEGVLAGGGKITGILYQGVDVLKVSQVLNLQSRLLLGDFRMTNGAVPEVLLGKGLAQQFQLKPGDQFKVVFPLPSELDPTQFRRKVATFKVSGILDLGKKEFDDRMIVGSLQAAQKMADLDRSSGILLRMSDLDQARVVSGRLSRDLGPLYQVSDWRDINENLFEAVQIERIVVFFVILIIVIAAAFNVSSALFINVVKRYPDIGVLKTLGFSKKQIIQLFSLQGLLMGAAGLFLGIGLGWILCQAFTWAEVYFAFIPTSVYKLDRIDLNIRFIDILSISSATLAICFLATLAPALRGARLTVVEGIKNE
jgi:lipoprotein-releasing system permease protein